MVISSIKLAPFPLPLPLPKPLSPSPLFPFKSPPVPSIRAPKTLIHVFYTERTPISAPPPKPKNRNPSDPDDIAVLNERIRRELGKRERSKGGEGQELDSKEAEKYIKLVKQQQQRGLQKLKGDIDGKRSGFGYRVDPYTLKPGDYVVHKKVGIGKFVAIKYDVPTKEGSVAAEPVEYVFIEYGDGMAKLPVKQAAKMLYRYNL